MEWKGGKLEWRERREEEEERKQRRDKKRKPEKKERKGRVGRKAPDSLPSNLRITSRAQVMCQFRASTPWAEGDVYLRAKNKIKKTKRKMKENEVREKQRTRSAFGSFLGFITSHVHIDFSFFVFLYFAPPHALLLSSFSIDRAAERSPQSAGSYPPPPIHPRHFWSHVAGVGHQKKHSLVLFFNPLFALLILFLE